MIINADIATKISADPKLQAVLTIAIDLAAKATRDEAVAQDRAAEWREDNPADRRYWAKIAKQSRQLATDAANDFVALLAASL